MEAKKITASDFEYTKGNDYRNYRTTQDELYSYEGEGADETHWSILVARMEDYQKTLTEEELDIDIPREEGKDWVLLVTHDGEPWDEADVFETLEDAIEEVNTLMFGNN